MKHEIHLIQVGGANLEDDVDARPKGGRIGNDARTCAAIRVVVDAGRCTGPGLHGHGEAEFHQLLDDIWYCRHASLAWEYFFWNPDRLRHVCISLSQIQHNGSAHV